MKADTDPAPAMEEESEMIADVELKKLLRRDWAVRVLDEQLEKLPHWCSWEVTRESTIAGQQWSVSFTDSDRESLDGVWDETGASTPDAARLAAARAVLGTLPAEVRSRLGECP